jgi:transposase
MDNAQIHHDGRVEDILESQGYLVIYLPPYSPDLKPIKKGFSFYKSTLRRFKQLLTGDEEDYNFIDKFVFLVFTSDLNKKLFQGSGYTA